jgi:hypothetical protein
MSGTQFDNYDEATQRHIIELGCFIYDKSLEHMKYSQQFHMNSPSSSSSECTAANSSGGDSSSFVWAKEYEYNQLKRQYENLSTRVYEIREEEYKKGEIKAAEYKQALFAERQRLDKLVSTFQTETDRQVASNTASLKKQIAELEVKNKWYYSLYEDKSKGKNYEEELYPKMLDYNDKHQNSVWNITHVGSVLSEKTDFHFRHKDLGVVILIDTKNNLPTNPVVSTAEFERDIIRKETNAIGGIMLANGHISCKKQFEINKIQEKYLVYVSDFERNNIGYIFSLLDMIIEMSRSVDPTCNKTTLRRILLDDYKREQSTLDNIERMRKISQKNIDAIVSDYKLYFNEDIEMGSKSEEVQASSVRVKEKTSSDIIDFDVIEQGRNVIGHRSKYYLEYGTTIQYFKNNYARNHKMKSLEINESKVILSVKTDIISDT